VANERLVARRFLAAVIVITGVDFTVCACTFDTALMASDDDLTDAAIEAAKRRKQRHTGDAVRCRASDAA